MVTRKKFFSLLIAISIVLSTVPTSYATKAGFTDVPSNHWAKAVIEKWADEKYDVLKGDGKNNFFPNQGLTIGELATILSKTFGYQERTQVEVTPSWADDSVEKAVAAGVMERKDKIDASVLVTREEAVKYISLAYGIDPLEGETSFVDNSFIGKEYKPYVNALQTKGYIKGTDKNPSKSEFKPKANYTRAEAMQVIDSMVSDIVENSLNGQKYNKNLVIRKPGISINNTTVQKSVIVGQGVGDGTLTIDKVDIADDLLIYGGDSIAVKGNDEISSTVVNKPYGQPVKLNGKFGTVKVKEGTKVILNGSVKKLILLGRSQATIDDAKFHEVDIMGDGVDLIANNSSVIDHVVISSDSVLIKGNGRVKEVDVVAPSRKDVRVMTSSTKVTVDIKAGAVKIDNGWVQPGTSVVTSSDDTSGGGGSSGGSSSGSISRESGNVTTGSALAISVITSFPQGDVEDNRVAVAYDITSRSGIEVTEVSYSINGNAEEYLYLSGNGGVSTKGSLCTGTVLLVPGENNIVFLVRDASGGVSRFEVAQKPYYKFGKHSPNINSENLSPLSDGSGRKFVNNRIIAFTKETADKFLFEEVIHSVGGKVIGQVNILDMYTIELPKNTKENLLNICNELLQNYPSVFSEIKLDIVSEMSVADHVTNDSWWNENNEWGLGAIKVPEAWERYRGHFRDIKLGVVDDGFALNHEDLQLNQDNIYNRGLADKNHGSHVMGTIAAVHNNNRGISGVIDTKRELLYGYDSFDFVESPNDVFASDSAILEGLAWNVVHGAKAINVSLGYGNPIAIAEYQPTHFFEEGMRKLLEKGYDFIVVQAAGNSKADAKWNGCFTSIRDSRLLKRIITVGATDRFGEMAVFSNYGDYVDVVAPGVDIYSSIADGENRYAHYAGTSMAAPHTTGLVSLVWSVNPGLSAEQVKEVIVESAKEHGLRVYDSRSGVPSKTYYQINALAAIQKAIGEAPEMTNGRLAGQIVEATYNGSEGAKIRGAKITLHSTHDSSAIRETVSDNEGHYVLENIETGNYYLQIAAEGYIPEKLFIQIEAGVTTNIHRLRAVPNSLEDGTVKGNIRNAVNGQLVTDKITLEFRRGIDYAQSEIVKTIEVENGLYSVTLPAGNYTITAKGQRYIETRAYAYSYGGQVISNQNIVISPEIEGGNSEFRVVLDWGALPWDLDSHMVGPTPSGRKFHIYYSDMDYSFDENGERKSYVNLDVDDTTSYGPETVTVNKLVDGKYDYYIQDYSNLDSVTSNFLRNSQAVVRVYSSENHLLKTFNVPTHGGPSTIWHVFSVEVENGRYNIVPVNTMHNVPTEPYNVGGVSRGEVEGNEFFTSSFTSEEDMMDKKYPITGRVPIDWKSTLEMQGEMTSEDGVVEQENQEIEMQVDQVKEEQPVDQVKEEQEEQKEQKEQKEQGKSLSEENAEMVGIP